MKFAVASLLTIGGVFRTSPSHKRLETILRITLCLSFAIPKNSRLKPEPASIQREKHAHDSMQNTFNHSRKTACRFRLIASMPELIRRTVFVRVLPSSPSAKRLEYPFTQT